MPTIRFSDGLCTSKERGSLTMAQLQVATGIYYRPGDTVGVHKIGGRDLWGDTTVSASTTIKGLQFCPFDAGGTDLVIAYSGTTLFKSAISPVTWSALVASLDASATKLGAAHAYNKWYLCNGYDRNKVLLSDGTSRSHGMAPPAIAPVCTAGASGGTYTGRPTANAGGTTPFLVPTGAYDAPTAPTTIYTLFAYKGLQATGSAQHTWTTLGASTASGRKIVVTWGVEGTLYNPGDLGSEQPGNFGANVSVLIEYSINSGSNWSTLENRLNITTSTGYQESSIAVSANSNLIQVRVTYTYNSGTTLVYCRVYDVRVTNANPALLTTTTGLYYAFTEWDAVNSIESASSPYSSLVTLSAQDYVTIAIPGTAGQVNTNSTHYKIYRTTDGGSVPGGLGLIATVPIAETTYRDEFVLWPKDTQPLPLYALLTVERDGGTIRVPRDGMPSSFTSMSYYKGSIVGFSRTQPRAMYYSYGGRPDSWPAIYVIEDFPMPEHDTLVTGVPCGDSFLIAGKELMMTLDDLPKVQNGQLAASDVRPLRGQPGCVSQDAICSYSISGEPRVAWVSYYGLHETNGTTSRLISQDIDWANTSGLGNAYVTSAVLRFDPKIKCLVLSCDTTGDGVNDRFYLIHVSPEHQTTEGQPKWTGPHYGYIQSMTGGISGNVYYRWSGHGSDGKVYIENTGVVDDSQAYSGTTVPVSMTTGRIYGDRKEWGVYKMASYYKVANYLASPSFAWTCGRDPSGITKTKTNSAATASGDSEWKAHEFFVGLQGQWHELTITFSAADSFAIRSIDFTALTGHEPGVTR